MGTTSEKWMKVKLILFMLMCLIFPPAGAFVKFIRLRDSNENQEVGDGPMAGEGVGVEGSESTEFVEDGLLVESEWKT